MTDSFELTGAAEVEAAVRVVLSPAVESPAVDTDSATRTNQEGPQKAGIVRKSPAESPTEITATAHDEEAAYIRLLIDELPPCSAESRIEGRGPGIYVVANLNGLDTVITVDSGASHSCMSKTTYDLMPNKPELQVCKSKLRGAGGTMMKIFGMATVEVSLGGQIFNRTVFVTELSDEFLLGLDFAKSLDIIMSEKKVKIDGLEVACHVISPRAKYKVSVVDPCIIPANAEGILRVDIEQPPDRRLKDVLIEDALPDKDKYPWAVAAGLCNLERNVMGLIKVLNLSDKEVKIFPEQVIAEAEEIDATSLRCTKRTR